MNSRNSKKEATLLITGPSLQAVSGITTHLHEIFNSDLNKIYRFRHFQVGSQGRNESCTGCIYRLLKSYVDLYRLISKEKIDLVHINTAMDNKALLRDVLYLTICRMTKKKIILQFHAGDKIEKLFGKNNFFGKVKKIFLFKANSYIFLLNHEAEVAKKHLDEKKIHLIRNAIDLSQYEQEKSEKDFYKDEIRLGYIGRLDPQKGLEECIESLAILRDRSKMKVTLTIAGTGSLSEKLKIQVKQWNLLNRVHFLGAVFGEEKAEFWRRTHIFLFPTFFPEGIPYTILEALASGTPMITTRSGGIKEILEDCRQCVFVDPKNPEQIAANVMNLGMDRNRLQTMSHLCRQKAKEEFSIERLVFKLNGCYQSLLEQPAANFGS